MSFEKLLEDLAALSTDSKTNGDVTKSMVSDGDGDDGADGAGAAGADDGADDAKVAAAAADGADAGAAADGADDDDGEQFGKSLKVVGDDGVEQDAIDATDLIKSLVERVESSETNMGKAVGLLTDLVKSQAAAIGDLRSEVTRLGSSGRGRKAVVTVADKPGATDLSKSGSSEDGISADDFMAKCLAAQTAGKISGTDVARAEAYINRGLDVPAGIKARVFA